MTGLFKCPRSICSWRAMALLLLMGTILLAGCVAPTPQDESELSGALLVWHTWPEPESAIIDDLLDSFSTVYRGVNVISEYVSEEDAGRRFQSQAATGLGPDVLIGADLDMVRDLADAGSLLDLSRFELQDSGLMAFLDAFDLDTANLTPEAVSALRQDNSFYGVPFAGYTTVLYYNKELVSTRAATLSSLIEQAQEGSAVLLPTDFFHAYWGIKAFNGEVLDAEGLVGIDQGYVSWLEWLLEAQAQPTIILSTRYEDLLETFASGNAAYLIGDSSDLPQLLEHLGEEKLGVTMLPTTSSLTGGGQSGGILDIRAIVVNRVSAEEEIVLRLVEFLTNDTQQRKLALAGWGQIPINNRIRLDSRLSPTAATLLRQSRYGVIFPLSQVKALETLKRIGNEVYLQVLEGEIGPEAGAVRLSEEYAEAIKPETAAEE